jgi:hypothetical protein
MFFLIDYDRPQGRIVSMQTFPDTDYMAAMDARLEIELDLFHRKIPDREVVVLQADSLETLKVTHSRYFKTLQEHFDELVTAITRR